MDKLDQWITREDENLPFDDATVREAAESQVVLASRRLYDADLACQRAPRGATVAELTKLEQAKAKAVEAWREAMRALRETDPD